MGLLLGLILFLLAGCAPQTRPTDSESVGNSQSTTSDETPAESNRALITSAKGDTAATAADSAESEVGTASSTSAPVEEKTEPMPMAVTETQNVPASQAATADQTHEDDSQLDWPDFRNGLELRGVAGSTLPAQLELLWEREVVDGVTSTPAIVGNHVYVPTLGGLLYCLNLANGEIVWEYSSVDPEEPVQFPPAFIAPVTVHEGIVYAGDDIGLLHAIDAQTGEWHWKVQLDSDIVSGAAVVEDRVICGCSAGYLYGFSREDGRELWKFNAHGPINGNQAFDGYSTFVTGCDKPILRVVDVRTGEQIREVELEGLLIASPALVNGVLYYGDSEGRTLALDWNAGVNIWTYTPETRGEIHSSPAVLDDIVVIGSRDRNVHAVDRRTGEQRWVFPTRGQIDGSPVIVEDRVFIASADRNIYGLRLADGAELWRYHTGERITGSPAVGRGRLVIGTEGARGKILCFGEPNS